MTILSMLVSSEVAKTSNDSTHTNQICVTTYKHLLSTARMILAYKFVHNEFIHMYRFYPLTIVVDIITECERGTISVKHNCGRQEKAQISLRLPIGKD